jgi:hypothetical protein
MAVLQSKKSNGPTAPVLAVHIDSASKENYSELLRRYINFANVFLLLAISLLLTLTASVSLGFQDGAKTAPQTGQDKPQPTETPKKVTGPRSGGREFSADEIVEGVIITGTRGGLEQIRRNGLERGRLTRIGADGRTEEASYERRFIRGASSDKDKVRLDQKLPTLEYSLLYGDGRLWGIINGAAFTPREDATVEFQSQLWHGIDALLRYKENGSTVSLGGKDKREGVEYYIIDLKDKDQRSTRYYISTRTLRVMMLEYQDAAAAGGTTAKYMRRFYDYRLAQGTLVPFRSVFYEEGKPSQETRVLTITYGIKMEDSLFRNPDAPQPTSARQ